MNSERLKRIRNFQSKDWYAAIVMRPICILVMLVVADWKWLTPNVLTTLAIVSKVVAAVLIAIDFEQYMIPAVVLLQLGLLFDHLDGTVARYRQCGSAFGAFYDKVCDAICWFLVMLAIGWVAYQRTGQCLHVMLAASSAYALLTVGYMKWVLAGEQNKLEWLEARLDPHAAVTRKSTPPTVQPPPQRSLRDWAAWLVKRNLAILKFDEVDLFFWVGLLLILDEVELLVWLLFVSQGILCGVMLVKRALQAVGVDRAIDRLRSKEE